MGNKPTAEFRQEVVRVALTSGLSRKQVASDFGIGFSTLSRWIKEERDTVSTPEPQIDLIHENERLRKEVRMLREEYPSWSSRFFSPFSVISQ
jgi:transposase